MALSNRISQRRRTTLKGKSAKCNICMTVDPPSVFGLQAEGHCFASLPAAYGVPPSSRSGGGVLRPGYLDVDAAIRLQTLHDFGTLRAIAVACLSGGLRFTFAHSLNPLTGHIVASQIVFHCVRAPRGERAIVLIAADTIGVP